MKKIFSILFSLCLMASTYAQKDFISTVFDKYAGKEGITTVNISGDMLKLFTDAEQQKRDTVLTSKLNEIRIIALEKGGCDQPVTMDLRTEVYDKLDKSEYKEMLSVKQADEDVVILMKEVNGRIKELLIIAGGDNNALIQVKGDMLFSEMADLANHYQVKGFEQLKKLEK